MSVLRVQSSLMRPHYFSYPLLILLLVCVPRATADRNATVGHGIAMHGDLKYAADFEHFRKVMGRKAGDSNFDSSADHNDDGRIGGSDFAVFTRCMNRKPGPSLVASRDTRACP